MLGRGIQAGSLGGRGQLPVGRLDIQHAECQGRASLRNSSCPRARAQDRAGRPGRAVSLGQSRGKDIHNQAQTRSWLSMSA